MIDLTSPYPSVQTNSRYSTYPSPLLLVERLEIVGNILHWRKEPLLGNEILASQSRAAVGRPASRSPQLLWANTQLQTAAVTWAVAYGRYPTYRLVLRQGPGSACNDLRNLVQVQYAKAFSETTYVEYFFHWGMVVAQVVPRVSRTAKQSKALREVHCRIFPDISSASDWAERKKQELLNLESAIPLPKPKPAKPAKPVRCVTLPNFEEDEDSRFFPTLDIADLQCSDAPLPAFSPIKLDMLSYRACERFVGMAVNFSRENSGLLPDGKTLGAHLTVTLGAVDGAWKATTTLVDPLQRSLHHTRSSQEAALAPFSVSAWVRVGRSPGGAPKALRMALLEAYRATPPSTEDRRTALALLTSARIPVLGQSLSKKKPPKRLVPEGLSPATPQIPLPLFLADLVKGLDLKQYRPMDSPLGDATGLLLVIQRTRGGFLFRLHGGEKGLNDTERKAVRLITQKLYPARVGAAAFRKVGAKTVYRNIVTSLERISKLSTVIADKITERLSQEHGWNATKERKEKELHKKIPTLANRQFATKGTKNTFMVMIDGTEMKLTEALRKYNHVVSYQTARIRITRSGWTAKAAVSTPAHGRKPSRKPGPTVTPPVPGRPQTGS